MMESYDQLAQSNAFWISNQADQIQKNEPILHHETSQSFQLYLIDFFVLSILQKQKPLLKFFLWLFLFCFCKIVKTKKLSVSL